MNVNDKTLFTMVIIVSLLITLLIYFNVLDNKSNLISNANASPAIMLTQQAALMNVPKSQTQEDNYPTEVQLTTTTINNNNGIPVKVYCSNELRNVVSGKGKLYIVDNIHYLVMDNGEEWIANQYLCVYRTR